MAINSQENAYLLQELERLLGRLDVQILYEHLSDAKSGLCTLKGRACLIIDKDVSEDEKLALFKSILTGYDLSKMYLAPAVREFLSKE